MCRASLAAALLAGTLPLSFAGAQEAGRWTERISPEGDIRLRYESIERQPGEDDHRYRYRARAGVSVDVTDHLEFGLRLATGEGSPTSTNLDFGESLSLEDIRVDRAYAAFSVSDALRLTAGKMKNPLVRAADNALMWDGDVTPEGVAANLRSGMLFATAAGFLLNDRDRGPDAHVFAAQAGLERDLSSAAKLTVGLGWFDFADVRGHAALHGTNALGNRVDAAGNYINDFNIVNLFVEIETSIREWPLTLFAERAQNTAASTANTASAVGARLGSADDAGGIEMSWEWRDTEADALVAVYTDSDFAAGRTDSSGHELTIFYRLDEHVGFGATAIFSEYGRLAGTPVDFDRLMLDVQFNF